MTGTKAMKIAKNHRFKPNRKLSLTIQYAVQSSPLPRGRLLKRWVKAALQYSTRCASITLRMVSEEEGRKINCEYRHKDYATNVLTFVLHDTTHEKQSSLLFGDIILTIPVIEAEAKERKLPLEAHFAHLVIHGMLHLQGYTHDDEDNANAMEALEISILQKLGYANPYFLQNER